MIYSVGLDIKYIGRACSLENYNGILGICHFMSAHGEIVYASYLCIPLNCFQFDKAYQPTRLGNWEVPKWHLNRPKGRSTVTKVIANDRGHLLPGVQKTDQKHWAGLYLGTYQLPKRISKEIGTVLLFIIFY